MSSRRRIEISEADIVPLRQSLPLESKETLTSFVSRLAALNWAKSAREFCRDFYLDFGRISAGDPRELALLSKFSGVPLSRLLANATKKLKRATFEFNGQTIHAHLSSVGKTRLCPACALEDIERGPDLSAEAAVFGRIHWLVAPIRTCTKHQLALATVPARDYKTTGDFALRTNGLLCDLQALRSNTLERSATALEVYLERRLYGVGDNAFLDRLPYASVAQACEHFGCWMLFGPLQKKAELSEEGFWRAGSAGYSILSRGQAGIGSFLADMQANAKDNPSNSNGHLAMGLLADYLNYGHYELRSAVAGELCKIYPYGPENRTIFGVPITRRYIHSFFSAAKYYGLDNLTLTKYVTAAGIGRRAPRRPEKPDASRR